MLSFTVNDPYCKMCRSHNLCTILRKQKRSYNKLVRRNGENCGANLRESSISQENLSRWNLDSEEHSPENKLPSPGRDCAAGGKVLDSNLESPVQQLILEPTSSEHVHKRTQNSKQEIFPIWSYPLKKRSVMENRELIKSSVETGLNVSNNSIRLFTLSPSLSSSPAEEQAACYHPELPVSAGLCWPYADGDFFKDKYEFHMNSGSTVENNNSDTLSVPNWNLKYGNSNMEENLTDESDLSESEKVNDTLLGYFKKMDLNLKPETIESFEESFTEESNEVFLYSDFLPSPLNTLDLHKFALSKCENWKATMEPVESSIEHLIIRLLELERLQHITIQKEKPRLQTSFCTPVVSERPSSSKAVSIMRQTKCPDSSSLQITYAEKSREKRKNNSVSSKPEQNASKWNWNNAGKYKGTSRPSLKSSSSTKQLIATYDDFKNPKSSILNPCQEILPKPTTAQTTQSLVKMASKRCLPPRSPIPVSPVPLSFPEKQRDEIKALRTKKKLYRKTILMNRPFYIQKLNCLSPSFIIKDKCSPIDQK
ncbi:protein FAM217A isoform X2 [Castor canadensis]|uniref:Protein FAM217A n=1 Tax=Castor canadensis TaxID=51338 RepID=A0A8B7VF06_CASCN|nr:protein FAM217A [Castor canadensis]